MAYDTYAIVPGPGSAPPGPQLMQTPHPCMVDPLFGPQIIAPVKPMFVVNGNGVTLVTGTKAAGSRPLHGQQWARGTHVVLSQYGGYGQR